MNISLTTFVTKLALAAGLVGIISCSMGEKGNLRSQKIQSLEQLKLLTSFITVGTTTRKEVNGKLGEPNHVGGEAIYTTYGWNSVSWMLGRCDSPNHPVAKGLEVYEPSETAFTFVLYDSDGVVVDLFYASPTDEPLRCGMCDHD